MSGEPSRLVVSEKVTVGKGLDREGGEGVRVIVSVDWLLMRVRAHPLDGGGGSGPAGARPEP